jgi:hypothetical protein
MEWSNFRFRTMKYLFFTSAALLSACVLSTNDIHQIITLGDKQYSINIPRIPYVIKVTDGDVAATTKPDEPITEKDWRIEIYEKDTCPPLGIKVPTKISIGNDEGQWGRTDFWDRSDAMYLWRIRDEWRPEDASPFCKPSFPSLQEKRQYVDCPPSPKDIHMHESETGVEWVSCEQRQRNYEIEHGLYSAYAFCAEKDGKAVAICIQQMTDNEAMAKEIFETFRWTD